MVNSEDVRRFFKERPSLNKLRFSKEANIDKMTINNLLDGTNGRLYKSTLEKVEPVMRKYGWGK